MKNQVPCHWGRYRTADRPDVTGGCGGHAVEDAVCGAGLGSRFQAVPFQCAIRLIEVLVKKPVPPTAQALLAEMAAMPLRRPLTAK